MRDMTMRPEIGESLSALASIKDEGITRCDVRKNDGNILVSYFDGEENLVKASSYDAGPDVADVIREYHASWKQGDDGGALRCLEQLILRDAVPQYVWHNLINRQYHIGNWNVSAGLAAALGAYESRSFDPADPFFAPDFIIIGTMKGGTSSLYNYLCYHPSVINRHPKELHFFTINYQRGVKFYRRYFAQKRKYSIIGEASPSYFDWNTPVVAERIYEHLKNVKLILLLANPVKRAVSQYYHDLRIRVGADLGEDFVKEEDVLTVDRLRADMESGDDNYIQAGHYVERMPYWKKFMDEGRFIVFTQSALAEDTNGVVREVYRFLGLEDIPVDIRRIRKANVNKYPKPSEDVLEFLQEVYRESNEKLASEYGITF